MRLLARVCFFTFMLGACGPVAAPNVSDTVPRPAHAALAARALEGSWYWQHISEHDGTRRVEHEWWFVSATGEGHIRGHYDRRVTYLAIDGRPFACSQTPTYETLVRYQVEGAIEGDAAVLVEVGYEASPSACDRGFRKLGDYVATVSGHELRLQFGDRVQHLRRGLAVTTPNWPTPSELTTNGSFSWSAHEVDANRITTVQREEWQLREESGIIRGHYDRLVHVFAEDGHYLACANGPSYDYRDRFEISGSRNNGTANIREVAVVAGQHPCLGGATRHLDAASATLTPLHLELEWRGRRRQTLTRLQPGDALGMDRQQGLSPPDR